MLFCDVWSEKCCALQNIDDTVYTIYFASLIFRESGLQDNFVSG